MLNMATEFDLIAATARNLPFGDTLMPSATSPTGRVEPATGVSAPFDSMRKAEMTLDKPCPAYRNRPLGVTANEIVPDPPAGNGEPTGVKNPEVVSIEKALMSLLPLLEA
jgi:hypothetical protein